MDYKQFILDTMASNKYKGYTVYDWEDYFHIEGSEQFKDLMKSLNELENEFEIMRDENNRYQMLDNLDCIKGILRVNPKGFGFVENDEISVYANRKEIMKAFDGDEVLAKVLYYKDGSKECEILEVLKHNKRTIVGNMKVRKGKMIFLPDQEIFDRTFKIINMSDFKLKNDTKVEVYIERFGPTLKCRIQRVLGNKYDKGIDVLGILLEHDIESEFPNKVLYECNKISESISKKEKEGRLDLTNETIITIDGDDSKDFDDAVSVTKHGSSYTLGVHIADVSHYVTKDSALDKEAYKRGTSVYVCDRVVPMLPERLSNGICSLNPKVERLTISCIMDINKKGIVTNYKIVPSIIKSNERMTYSNVNKILKGDTVLCERYHSIVPMLNVMEELSLIIRQKRHLQGNIDFDVPEGKIIVDKNGKAIDVVLRERGESERIIEDFMISANECVASHVKNMDLPSIYRVHEKPEIQKMREFVSIAKSLGYTFKGDIRNVYPAQLQSMLEEAKGSESYKVLSTYMLRSMRKARYAGNCLGHFGLGLNEYTHFTSPIRRYPDLIVHRMLRKYFFNVVEDTGEYDKDEAWIEEAAVHTSAREKVAVEAERDVDDMKKAEYMHPYIGRIFTGVISSVTKFGVFVELDNTVEGLVHMNNMKDDYYNYEENSKSLIGERTGKVYKMGQTVRVKLIDANKFKKQIDFVFIENNKN